MALNRKSKPQIQRFLDQNMHKFDHPACYLGNEPNTFSWTDEEFADAKFRVLIACPYDQLQATGNTTIPLLYNLSNQWNMEDRVTERWYFPTSRREIDLMEKNGIPPWGLETRHALTDYDLIAMPLGYSPYLVNIVKTLQQAGMPIRARERAEMAENYPLLLVGGHTFANPWGSAPVVDVLWCGEAEDETEEAQLAVNMTRDEKINPATYWVKPKENPGMNAFIDDLAIYKEEGKYYDKQGREDMLHELSVKYKHIFVPRFYSLNYEQNKDNHPVVTGWDKKYDDLHTRVQKRFVKNLDACTTLVKAPILHLDNGMCSTVQAAKGCAYHCAFCAAAYREVPYRERSEQVMYDAFEGILKNTGAIDVSPLMLEFGTYSRKKALMKRVLEGITDEFSMPSLRVDVFGGDPVFGQLSVKAQQENVTIAIEGNSQRLREIVSKGIQEEDILRAFSNAIAAGYQRAKLYMLCNLPGEGAEDHAEIVELVRKMDEIKRAAGSKIKVRLSWKVLTIQPQTPFQWQPCRVYSASMKEAMQEIKAMGFGVQMGGETRSSLGTFVQVCELADEAAGEALVDTIIESDAVMYGALPRGVYDLIVKNLAKHGRTVEDYYRAKDTEETFAWDIVDSLVTKQYLLRFHENIQKRLDNDPEIFGQGFLERFGSCSIGCAQCGACDEESLDVMEAMATRVDEPVKLNEVKIIDRTTVAQKFVMKVDLDPSRRYCTDNYWQHVTRRAFYLTDQPVASKSIKISTQRIKAAKTWFSGRAYIEVGLTRRIQGDDLIDLLRPELEPHGITLHSIDEVPLREDILSKAADGILWDLELDQPAIQAQALLDKAMTDPTSVISFKRDSYMAGETRMTRPTTEVLSDAGIRTEGRRTILSMVVQQDISPYDVVASIMPRADIFRYPAVSQATLTGVTSESDAFSKNCITCDNPIPYELGGKLLDDQYCHRHIIHRVAGASDLVNA